MPLTNNVSKNIKELMHDNTLSGKARGANGKPRGRAQIIAIAENAAGKIGKRVVNTYHKSKGLYGSIINKALGGRFG